MFKQTIKRVLATGLCGALCLCACGCGDQFTMGATYFIKATTDASDAHVQVYVDEQRITEDDFDEEWTYQINGATIEAEYPVVTVEVSATDDQATVSCGIALSPDKFPVKDKDTGSASCVFDASKFSSYYN